MRIDAIPIWALFAGTIIVVMIAIEAGYRLGRGAHRRSEDEKESPVSAIASAGDLALARIGHGGGLGEFQTLQRPII